VLTVLILFHPTAQAADAPQVIDVYPVVDGNAGAGGVSAGPGTLNGEIDSDGDGFSDTLETAAGTNPMDAASTPAGSEKLTQAAIASPQLKVVTKKNKAPTLTFAGTLHIPAGFAPAGKVAVIDIGGFTQKFTLDTKGMGKAGKDVFKLTLKAKKKVVIEQDAKFKINLNGNVPDTVKPDAEVQILIGGTVFTK